MRWLTVSYAVSVWLRLQSGWLAKRFSPCLLLALGGVQGVVALVPLAFFSVTGNGSRSSVAVLFVWLSFFCPVRQLLG